MDHTIITAVTAEPISLAEARLQCKVDSDDTTHDAVLSALITAAREFAEHYTGRALAPQTLELALPSFPTVIPHPIFDHPAFTAGDLSITLSMPPVSSITHIKYTDTAGVEQTIAGSAYALSTYGDSRTIAPTYGNYWPTTRAIPDAVRVRYVTGYTQLPKAVKAALLLHVELESPLNPHTPAERESLEKARDSLLNTVKVWGF